MAYAEIDSVAEIEWKPRMHKALSFDGQNDYVQIPDDSSLDIINPQGITIYTIVYINTLNTPQVLCRRENYGWEFSISSAGYLNFWFGKKSEWSIQHKSNSKITLNKWQNLVVTYDNSNVKFYIDSSLDGTISNTDGINTSNATITGIGANGTGTSWFLNGQIAHVSIYNRALSDAEIKYLYQNPFDPLDDDSLVLWLNPAGIDTTNGKWWDLSGNDNHGTIYGATEVSLVSSEVSV
jgi:hypothetical protein